LFGFPKVIQSDNGTEFVNNIINQLIKTSGISHRLVTPYNPHANGSAECTVQTAVQLISKLIKGYKNNWDIYTNFTQYCINQKISNYHKQTPFFAMFGRCANAFNDFSNSELYNDKLLPAEIKENIKQIQDFASKLQNEIFPNTNNKTSITNSKRAKYFNKKNKLIDIPIGTYVMIKSKRNSKLDERNIGPYEIIAKHGTGTYTLKDQTNQLLPHKYVTSQLHPLSTIPTENKVHYEVESILQHKTTNTGFEYLVKWKGYNNPNDLTWEPDYNFDSNEIISEYWKIRNQEASKG
jgi:hypothetical protein